MRFSSRKSLTIVTGVLITSNVYSSIWSSADFKRGPDQDEKCFEESISIWPFTDFEKDTNQDEKYSEESAKSIEDFYVNNGLNVLKSFWKAVVVPICNTTLLFFLKNFIYIFIALGVYSFYYNNFVLRSGTVRSIILSPFYFLGWLKDSIFDSDVKSVKGKNKNDANEVIAYDTAKGMLSDTSGCEDLLEFKSKLALLKRRLEATTGNFSSFGLFLNWVKYNLATSFFYRNTRKEYDQLKKDISKIEKRLESSLNKIEKVNKLENRLKGLFNKVNDGNNKSVLMLKEGDLTKEIEDAVGNYRDSDGSFILKNKQKEVLKIYVDEVFNLFLEDIKKASQNDDRLTALGNLKGELLLFLESLKTFIGEEDSKKLYNLKDTLQKLCIVVSESMTTKPLIEEILGTSEYNLAIEKLSKLKSFLGKDEQEQNFEEVSSYAKTEYISFAQLTHEIVKTNEKLEAELAEKYLKELKKILEKQKNISDALKVYGSAIKLEKDVECQEIGNIFTEARNLYGILENIEDVNSLLGKNVDIAEEVEKIEDNVKRVAFELEKDNALACARKLLEEYTKAVNDLKIIAEKNCTGGIPVHVYLKKKAEKLYSSYGEKIKNLKKFVNKYNNWKKDCDKKYKLIYLGNLKEENIDYTVSSFVEKISEELEKCADSIFKERLKEEKDALIKHYQDELKKDFGIFSTISKGIKDVKEYLESKEVSIKDLKSKQIELQKLESENKDFIVKRCEVLEMSITDVLEESESFVSFLKLVGGIPSEPDESKKVDCMKKGMELLNKSSRLGKKKFYDNAVRMLEEAIVSLKDHKSVVALVNFFDNKENKKSIVFNSLQQVLDKKRAETIDKILRKEDADVSNLLFESENKKDFVGKIKQFFENYRNFKSKDPKIGFDLFNILSSMENDKKEIKKLKDNTFLKSLKEVIENTSRSVIDDLKNSFSGFDFGSFVGNLSKTDNFDGILSNLRCFNYLAQTGIFNNNKSFSSLSQQDKDLIGFFCEQFSKKGQKTSLEDAECFEKLVSRAVSKDLKKVFLKSLFFKVSEAKASILSILGKKEAIADKSFVPVCNRFVALAKILLSEEKELSIIGEELSSVKAFFKFSISYLYLFSGKGEFNSDWVKKICDKLTLLEGNFVNELLEAKKNVGETLKFTIRIVSDFMKAKQTSLADNFIDAALSFVDEKKITVVTGTMSYLKDDSTVSNFVDWFRSQPAEKYKALLGKKNVKKLDNRFADINSDSNAGFFKNIGDFFFAPVDECSNCDNDFEGFGL